MRSVYLIRGNDGNYKIGIAKDPKKRLKQLQTGNSDELQLIESYESEHASKIESSLHHQYSHLRTHGEWFELSIVEEIKFIDQCKQLDKNISLLQKMGNSFV